MANAPDETMFREGSGVLVKTRFDGKWASGFEIAHIRRRGVVPPAYRIRRRSDHAVLPGLFPEGELRPDR